MKLVMPCSSHACFPAGDMPHSTEPQPEEQERHQSFRPLEIKTYSLPGKEMPISTVTFFAGSSTYEDT